MLVKKYVVQFVSDLQSSILFYVSQFPQPMQLTAKI